MMWWLRTESCWLPMTRCSAFFNYMFIWGAGERVMEYRDTDSPQYATDIYIRSSHKYVMHNFLPQLVAYLNVVYALWCGNYEPDRVGHWWRDVTFSSIICLFTRKKSYNGIQTYARFASIDICIYQIISQVQNAVFSWWIKIKNLVWVDFY